MKLPVMSPEHSAQLQAFEAKILSNHAKIEAYSARSGAYTARRFTVRSIYAMPVTKFRLSI